MTDREMLELAAKAAGLPKKSSDAISAKIRNAGRFGPFVPRQREPNEALPPRNSVWERPVYVPSRDNK